MQAAKLSRVDEATGRVARGSRRQIQTWVNFHRAELSNRVLAVLSPPLSPEVHLRWVSPLVEEKYKEYQDADFLEILGLGSHLDQLKDFWPKGGPHWDALAVIEGMDPRGVVLVESKSHISEMNSRCEATQGSKDLIEKSLDETARALGANRTSYWTDHYYQAANRFAHLYFLREKVKVPAWLVNVYFVGDTTIQNVEPPPTSAIEWRAWLAHVKDQMAFTSNTIPYTADLVIEALPSND